VARQWRCISADSHLEIPSDRWTHRVPEDYRDRAPRRIRLANGGDAFVVENMPIYYGGMNLYAGKSPEQFNPIGLTWDDTPGTGPPEQRLREQDRDGVDAEVLFPGVGGRRLWRGIADDRAYLAILRAYNEYLAEDYCAVEPERLIGLGVIPETSIDDAIAELEYCARAGLKGINLGAFPSGKPYPTPEDDRFWAATLDLQMPVTVHVSFAQPRGAPVFKYPKEPNGDMRPADPVERLARYGVRGNGLNAVQLVVAGVFDRFPALGIFFAETQIGWIPIYLEQMDHNYTRHRFWVERVYGLPPLKRLPSEYIREHCWWGFFNDNFGLRVRHEIGPDRIMWSTDFPHVESDWPNSQALIDEQFAGVPDDEKQRILAGNCMEFFHLGRATASRLPTAVGAMTDST
jgi:predicted TIM-barrel fold metal-dependent hydrolase